jgi:hypothetical protein
MGDTWFQTPSQATTGNANWYTQIDGYIDKDDEISFYAENGRQVPNYIWWNYSYFPYRFEVQIVDPVDGGRSWMYIYYNNQSNYNFYTNGSAANLGNPKGAYTTTVKDYVSWDPGLLSISTDVYQLSVNGTNPTLLDSVKIVKDGSDGQNIIEDFGKMYGFGYFEDTTVGAISGMLSAGRDGPWYSYSNGAKTLKGEMIAVLDNPAVWYDQLYYDISDPDRSNDSAPYQYDPPEDVYDRYVQMGHTPPSTFGDDPFLDDWEESYGDNRAIVDGDIRVIQYISQWLGTGIYKGDGGCVTGDEAWIVLLTSMLDGPMYYYRNLQESPSTSTALPYVDGISIEIYYVYIECGNIVNNIRDDMTMYAGQEWDPTNAPDGIDQSQGFDTGIPASFSYANQYGWTKYGGIDPKTSDYVLLGTCVTDGGGGAGNGDGDFFYSGTSTNIMGDPLQDANSAAAKPSPNNGHNSGGNVPDWVLFDSETHGGFWLYIPQREIIEIQDNFGDEGFDSPGSDLRFHYRDDQYRSEVGFCAVDDTGPVYGGSSTSEYHFRFIFDVFTGNKTERAHKDYLRYWHDLTGISTYTPQEPAPSFHWEYATPDKTIYGQGDTITINAKGDHNDATILADFSDIDSTPNSYNVDNHGDGTYTITYDIVDTPHSTPYERLIILTAQVSGYDDSVINITVNIDDIVPTSASLDTLSLTTSEMIVYLNWTDNPAYDVGCSSVGNPSGIDKYRIWRRTSSTSPIILKDDLAHTTTETTDTFLTNGETYYYKIEAFDKVGNSVNSTEVSTTIDLPYTPAQPNDLPATINPSLQSPTGVTINWTENPGNFPGGVTLQNYYVYRSTSPSSGYIVVSSALGTTTYAWTDSSSLDEAETYYYKVLSDTDGSDCFSAPVHTRIDTVDPNPGEIADFFPTYYSQSEEIVVSWAIEKLDQYETGGFPGNDLNGIDHWDLYKKVGAGSFNYLATIPYGPNTADQRYYDYDVSDGTTYAYRLYTVDAAGNSIVNQQDRSTILEVVGPGRCEVKSVTTSPTEVSPNDLNVPIKVVIRNPGASSSTLNSIELKFKIGTTVTTSNYTETTMTGINEVINTTVREHTYWFYVNVSAGALPGLTVIDAKCTYDTTGTDSNAEFADS